MVAQSTIDRVKAQLLALLPPGALFWRGATAKIVALIAAISVEFARVHEQLDALRAAVLPSEAEEFIFDWERTLGLPHAGTTEARLAAISAKLLDRGGVSIPYFKALAAAFGYAIEIQEYLPARIGRMRCGDRMDGLGWGATWTVDVRSGSNDAALEAALIAARPAHTRVIFRWAEWTTRTTALGTNISIRGVAYNGSVYVAVGSGGSIFTSTDLDTWTARTSGTSVQLNGVCWTGTNFVVVGMTNTVLTSPTGTTWTSRSGAPHSLWGVAWIGSGDVVAVGNNDTIITSADHGVSWTTRRDDLIGYGWIKVLCRGSELFVVGSVTASAADPFPVYHSTDGGATWSSLGTVAHVNPSAVPGSLRHWNDKIALAGDRNGSATSADSIVWTSEDGATWAPTVIPGGGGTSRGVAVSNGTLFVANALTGVYRTNDLRAWSTEIFTTISGGAVGAFCAADDSTPLIVFGSDLASPTYHGAIFTRDTI